MIDYDSDSFLLRNMIGVVWYLHMFFDNIELDGTDVDVQDRVSRDGYSSTTGVQLFVFFDIFDVWTEILMISEYWHSNVGRKQSLKLCQDVRGPCWTVHSGKEWGFGLDLKKEWDFEINIARMMKRLMDNGEMNN